MDQIKRDLAALAQYLDETHTLIHAGADTDEVLGAAVFGLTKLTEIVARMVDLTEDSEAG